MPVVAGMTLCGKITRDALTTKGVVAQFNEKYRVRLVPSIEAPFIEELSSFNKKDVLIIDLIEGPTTLDTAEGSDVAESPSETSTATGNESSYGGSPLVFSFLTLDKIRARDAQKRSLQPKEMVLSQNEFPANPIPVAEAMSLVSRLTTGDWPFDASSLSGVSAWVMTDLKDPRNTAMIGVIRSSKLIGTYHVQAFGRGTPGILKQLKALETRFSMFQSRSTARCTYDIIPEKPNDTNDADERVSASFQLLVKWQCEPDKLFTHPPPQAGVSVLVFPGWLDCRMPLQELASELRLLLALGRALRTGSMDWSEAKVGVPPEKLASDIRVLLKDSKILNEKLSKVSLESTEGSEDFTERLWMMMMGCSSNKVLVDTLGIVFDALRMGFKNAMIHEDNKCQMARFLRDACENELMLPRLEGLTPIEILLGMGLEHFSRKCVQEFIWNDLVANKDELKTFFVPKPNASCEDRVDLLFHVYNSLLVLTTCKQFLKLNRYQAYMLARHVLTQYDSSKVSPTSSSITASTLGNFNLNLNFSFTLVDVYPSIFKVKTPSTWVIETTYMEGKSLVAQTMTHFAKETKLKYVPHGTVPKMDSESDDVKSVESSADRTVSEDPSMESDAAGDVTLRKDDVIDTVRQEDLLKNVSDGYYCAYVTGSFHVLPLF